MKMKTMIYSAFRKFGIGMAMTMIALVPVSCKEDEPDSGETYFNVEEIDNFQIPYTGISKSAYGNGEKFIVRAHGAWRFESEDGEDNSWVKVFPMEGEDDGYIRIYSDENTQPIVRVAKFKVFLNDVEQPQRLEISQQNCQPFMNVMSRKLTFERKGGTLTVGVNANIDWECSVEGADASLFECAKKDDVTAEIKASVNTAGRELSATLVISGAGEFSSLRQEIEVEQLDATFFDNFSWLQCEAGINGWKIDTGKSEIRIDKWTAAEKAHGWTSLSNWLYARTGFVKFGKSGYGGDLASPKIEQLGSGENVSVSWKALGYGTASSQKDQIDTYYVAILGSGRITGCSSAGALGYTIPYKNESGLDVTLDAVKFTLPELAWLIPAIDPTAIEVWQYATSKFSIEVSGMDSSSRVIFVSGNGNPENSYQNENGHNSRFFLDDFKVVIN